MLYHQKNTLLYNTFGMLDCGYICYNKIEAECIAILNLKAKIFFVLVVFGLPRNILLFLTISVAVAISFYLYYLTSIFSESISL